MRRPRPAPAAGAGLLALVVLASAGWLAARPGGHPEQPTRPALPQIAGRPGVGDPAEDPARTAAVRALLARRATAIRAHDAAGLRATDDSASPAFTARDLHTLANLADVPLASFDYDLDPTAPTDVRPPARAGTSAQWAPAVVLRYAIAGFDAQPASLPQGLTFVQRDGAWLVAADSDPGAHTARDLWDGGPVIVRRGARSLVLAHPDNAALATGIAAEVDRDIPDVTAVWGSDWARRAVVLVPDDAHELAAIVQTTADLSAYAAVQSAELGQAGNGDQTPAGDRIGVNPIVYDAMSAPARRVLVTHELTHVASRADSGPDLPVWLVEGLADDVGFAPTGLGPRVVAADLAAEVAADHPPTMLPADAEFTGANPRLAAVYNEAWTACRLIVDRVGQAGLVRLYRRLGTDPGTDRAAAQARAFAAVLHETPAQFQLEWVATVARELS